MRKIKNHPKIDKALAILTIVLIALAVYLTLTNGFRVFMLNQNKNEQLIIPKENIRECCEYLDDEGFLRKCIVFADYDCSSCDIYCAAKLS